MTVIEAGMNGLALERSEPKEESTESGTVDDTVSPGSWLEGAFDRIFSTKERQSSLQLPSIKSQRRLIVLLGSYAHP